MDSADTNATTVYPDIIVHRRGTSDNHLVIEIKKQTGGPSERDLQKLRALRSQLGYRFALFIRFGPLEDSYGIREIEWVEK